MQIIFSSRSSIEGKHSRKSESFYSSPTDKLIARRKKGQIRSTLIKVRISIAFVRDDGRADVRRDVQPILNARSEGFFSPSSIDSLELNRRFRLSSVEHPIGSAEFPVR